MGKKQLFINLSSTILAFSTSLFISFILTPYLIKHLGKEAYSFYPMSNNFIGYITILTLALNSMVARFMSISYSSENYFEADCYFSSTFFSNVFVVLIIFFPISFFVTYLDCFLNIPTEILFDVKLLFFLVFLSLLINLVSSAFGVATFVANRLDLKAVGDLTQGILKIFLFFFLFYTYEASIVFIGIVAVILSCYNLFVQLYFKNKLLPNLSLSLRKIRISSIVTLLSSGFWNVVNSLGMSLLLGMSLFMTNFFIGAQAGGDLAMALMLPAFVSGIITMIVSVLLPRMTNIYSNKDSESLINEVLYSQKLLSLLTTVPISLLIIFGEKFFMLWVPSEYSDVLPVLSFILLLPLFVHGNMWSIYSTNIVLNKVKTPSLLLLFCGFLSVFFIIISVSFISKSVYVIPIVTTFISICYYLFFIPFYAAKQMSVSLFTFYPSIIKSFFFLVIFIYISTLIFDFIYVGSWSDFFGFGLIFAILGFCMHLLIILSKNEILLSYEFLIKFILKINSRVKNV
ncbi:oligosaccharide flippase family protein [Shewanella sp. CG12_big_fil_rev_8_21_14_0_65_47_15]|uniref:lipopolysaccharide biosynthesis protein n=1 Tax=Shewanella sp. CG12_big_fil_rev_8_21_14_0_65_47_15 TaxID=1975537 RepID=UPI000CBB4000|nr:oligosaccharide flippase family protein [Shewanella sp. CG12_big_fil_rev_8_21_14_0_65_47_15]PIW59853.1 MAG: hypothetical protein COW15_15705 [Shewanella sp. CG12_big_fil_rev_8_21_14_0_65_47_15]